MSHRWRWARWGKRRYPVWIWRRSQPGTTPHTPLLQYLSQVSTLLSITSTTDSLCPVTVQTKTHKNYFLLLSSLIKFCNYWIKIDVCNKEQITFLVHQCYTPIPTKLDTVVLHIFKQYVTRLADLQRHKKQFSENKNAYRIDSFFKHE